MIFGYWKDEEDFEQGFDPDEIICEDSLKDARLRGFIIARSEGAFFTYTVKEMRVAP